MGNTPIWKLPIEAKRELWKAAGYTPSKEQLEAHRDDHRLKLVAGGERAGKSMFTAHEVATWLIMGKPGDLLWLVGPSYDLSRPEMEHLIAGYTANGLIDAETIQTPAQGAWRMKTKTGVSVETKSSSDAIKLAGVAPIGIAMVEAAQQEYETFIRCRGRISQKRGPLLLSGTFEGSRGYYAQMFRDWQTGVNVEGGKSFSMPTWSNLHDFPGGREDPEIKALEATMPHDLFLERLGALPCSPTNLVLREFDPLIHASKPCPFDKSMPVQIWVDPGYGGAYSVCPMQIYGNVVRQIDEVYERGLKVHKVIDECAKRPWWENVHYGICDIAGNQHHADDSQIEIWAQYGKIRLYSQYVPIHAGITRHQTFLFDPASGQPLLFHDPRCVNTIREYGAYVYPKAHEGRNEAELPIDANNHCVRGDTKIDMPGGRRRIADLVGQMPYVYCCIDGKVKVRKAYDIHKTMESVEVVCVMMDRGELYLTPDHLVMLANGNYVEAARLRPGQSLMALNRYVVNDGYTRVCMTNQTRQTVSEHRLVYEEVYGEIPDGCDVHHKDNNYWNHSPDNLEPLTMEEHASRHHSGKIISFEQRAQISIVSKKNWADNYEKRAAIARANAIKAHEANVGHVPWNKGMVGGNHRVIAVVPAGREDVYDMNVEEAHNFIAEDVVIHNSMKAIAYGLVANFGAVERAPLGTVSVSFKRG